MHELTAIIGGSVGSRPYAENTWSGSAAHLFRAMQRANLLAGPAQGLDLSRPEKMLLMAKNFHPDRAVWRKHFFFDPAYRRALTHAARRISVKTPFTFQLGHMYSLPEAHPEAGGISYHDGNLAELQASGFGLTGVSAKRIDQALEYEVAAGRKMRAVFTMSAYLKHSFVSTYGLPAEKVFHVGGAVNMDQVPAAVPDKQYDGRRILFIASDFKRKGGETLFAALRQVREVLPETELHVVGPRALESTPPGVVLHGYLSKSDPGQRKAFEDLCRSASVFVLPSLYEPYGIAPIEAMLYQLPCIVTRAWALAETVVEGETGELVEKGNADELASKLIALLQDPERMQRMGAAGRERALHDYTWDAVAGRMQQAIATL